MKKPIYTDEETHAKLKKRALDEKKTMKQLATELIEDYLDSKINIVLEKK